MEQLSFKLQIKNIRKLSLYDYALIFLKRIKTKTTKEVFVDCSSEKHIQWITQILEKLEIKKTGKINLRSYVLKLLTKINLKTIDVLVLYYVYEKEIEWIIDFKEDFLIEAIKTNGPRKLLYFSLH